MRLSRWYFFLLCFYSFAVFSQDTIAPVSRPQTPVRITYVREIDIDNLDTLSHGIDSLLATFHRTRGFLYDIMQERNIFMEEVPFRKHVVNFSDDITFPYKLSDRTIRYYKLNKRFTEITYLLGAKKEQLINVVYTQNLLSGWSVGLDFRRAGSEGWFKRQLFYQSSFDVFTHYESANKRYQLYGYYLRNRLEQQENGGVNNFNPDENTVAQPTYLSTAENNQTEKEFLLRQSFQLRKQVPDSMPAPKNIFSIGHKVRYETRGTNYLDSPTDSFYQYSYFDSVNTHDSTWYQRWNNEFTLAFSTDKEGGLSLALSAGHEYFIYKYGSPETGLLFGEKENYYGSGALNWKKSRNYLDVKARMYFGDYDGDYDATFFYRRYIADQWSAFINARRNLLHPDLTDNRRYSNHFIWFNEFSPEAFQNAEAGLATTDKKFLVSASYSMYEDLIYYDSTAHPKQSAESINYYKLKLQKNFTWRNWILENIIEYQKANNEDIIHLPEWMTGHSLCYEKYFFKSALFARIGLDVRYVSAYYADRYMPALQQFYLQYDKQTGGYVFADFFITFRVKASRFFIKMENLFNGVSSEPQFFRPDYPLTPRYLRFGLQLRFFD
jgi:hypothetical protein